MSDAAKPPTPVPSRWPPTGRDRIAAVAAAVALVGLIAVGVGLEAAHRLRLERDREAAEAAARAAGPHRAPPITTSVYVRTVPVRHTQ